jgi:hypothetical protein
MTTTDTSTEPTMTTGSSKRIEFVAHARFHRTALHMAVAGGMAGLAAHVAALLDPRIGATAAPLPLAVVAGAACYGAAAPETRARARDLAVVVLGAAFAAGALAAVVRGEMAPAWGAALFSAALGLLVARGATGRRFWITAAAGAAAALAGRFVLTSLSGADFGPAWLVATGAGAAFGAVALLGTLPRHLQLTQVTRAQADSAEVLGRARTAAQSEPRVRVLLEQLDDLERQGAGTPPLPLLRERIADLEARASATDDDLARAEYEKAIAAVTEQLADVESIARGRERVIARLHRELEETSRSKLAAASAEVDATSQALLEADQ